MQADLNSGDLKLTWQNQPKEESKVGLLFIRQKARDLRAKTRRQVLATVAAPLVVAFFYVLCIKQFPNLGTVLHPLFAFALAWSIAGLYFLNRESRPGTLPADAGFSTGLEFCRNEIRRRQNYFRRDLLWSLGPILLAMGTLLMALVIVLGPALFVRAAPVTLLAGAWIAAYLFMRVRRQRELQRELKDLGEIEIENSR